MSHIKSITGNLGTDSVITLDSSRFCNATENMVTELAIRLDDSIFDLNYRYYFEFLLPTKTRFVSAPVVPVQEEFTTADPVTNLPKTYTAYVLHYKIPKYVAVVAGPLLFDIKATNDSITVYKSEVFNATINSSIDPELDERYYEGDLLDYLVTRKLDYMDYNGGYIKFYITDIQSGEHQLTGTMAVNPVFESMESALEYVQSDAAFAGQFISIIESQVDGQGNEKLIATGYLINPDHTLTTKTSVGGYSELSGLPKLDTSSTSEFQSSANETILNTIYLSKISKSGKLSDAQNDNGFFIAKKISINSAGEFVVQLSSIDRGVAKPATYFILDKISINSAMSNGDSFTIYNGNTEVCSSTDLPANVSAVEYELNMPVVISDSNNLRIVVTSSGIVDLDIYLSHD